MDTETLPISKQLGDAVLTRRQISGAILELAKRIDAHYTVESRLGPKLILIPILKSALYFCADLSREMLTPHQIEPVTYSSYESIYRDDGHFIGLDNEGLHSFDVLRDAHVLVVDVLVNSGKTMKAVRGLVDEYHPHSVDVCCLVVCARPGLESPRFCGYVHRGESGLYGYGMDQDGDARHLAAIYSA